MARSPTDALADGAPMAMRERIAAFDWAATPLGAEEKWPQCLRFAVDLCIHSSFPTCIYWGPEFRLIYNDAWSAIPGGRYRDALGKPARDVWPEIWPDLEVQLRRVIATGEGVSAYEALLPVRRDGEMQETYWNHSFMPIRGDADSVAGVLQQGNEITRTILAERRLSFQVALADALRESRSPDEAKAIAARLLGEHLHADRVGYSEVDAEGEILSTSVDWTRDPSIPSLVGAARMMGAFGRDAYAWLVSGKVMAVADHREDALTSSPEAVATFDGLGIRAMIVVPLVREGKMRAILYAHGIAPRHWTTAEIEIARDVAERTWAAVERAYAEQSLRESEDHYRHAVELSPQVTWTARPDGKINRISPRWEKWTGRSGVGDSIIGGVHPDDRQRVIAAWRHSVATGEPLDVEHRVLHDDGSARWARARAFPRHDNAGHICLWYGTTEDIEQRHQAQEHQRLLINELNHRVKNTLATVQAIAFQTLKGDFTLADARARFEARLLALSRAHNLLTEENWEGAPIWRIIADSTAHLGGEAGRFCLDGEPIWLTPRAALALALACHELSTNAAKYGALSNEKGHVTVRWQKDGDVLRIEWKEKGGPEVHMPSSRGFGSRLIERGLAGDLNGKARLDFEPDGLHCTIEAPLSAVQAREGEIA